MESGIDGSYISGWRSSRWSSLNLKVIEIGQDCSKTKKTIKPDTQETQFEDQVSSIDIPLTLNLPLAYADTNAIVGMCCEAMVLIQNCKQQCVIENEHPGM